MFLFLAIVVGGLVAHVFRVIGGDDAGDVAAFFLLIGAYIAAGYNFSVLQGRTGQSWGKRIMGLRAVNMVELRPASKGLLGLKPLFEMLEILCGVAFVSIAFSYYRQTLSDKFCGIVVIDERKAGMTLPWVLPGAPAMQVTRPVPQGGVPRPQRRGRQKPPAAPAWTQHPAPPPAESDDLPEPEVEDHPSSRGPDPWGDVPPDPPPRTTEAPRATSLDDSSGASVADAPARPQPPRSTPEGAAQHEASDDGPRFTVPPPGWTGSATPPAAPVDERAPSNDGKAQLDDLRYFGDPAIADAIRAGNLELANERAREALEVHWDQQIPLDIAELVAEYRKLIRRAGKVTRAADATVAGWLGLG